MNSRVDFYNDDFYYEDPYYEDHYYKNFYYNALDNDALDKEALNKEALNKEALNKDDLMKIERSMLSISNQIWIWWFFHSTPTGASSCEGEHIYLTCFNWCPGNLELKFSKCCCKKRKICFCCCFSLMFM